MKGPYCLALFDMEKKNSFFPVLLSEYSKLELLNSV